jgi:hypothetical protein
MAEFDRSSFIHLRTLQYPLIIVHVHSIRDLRLPIARSCVHESMIAIFLPMDLLSVLTSPMAERRVRGLMPRNWVPRESVCDLV